MRDMEEASFSGVAKREIQQLLEVLWVFLATVLWTWACGWCVTTSGDNGDL